MAIVGLVLLVLVVWPLMAALNKAHREETGVDAPTRSQMKYIRRKARQKGIGEETAYNQWVARKQRRPRK